MQINVVDPVTQNYIFFLIFSALVFFTLRKAPSKFTLTPQISSELKGIAIFTVLFGHIGYFLAKDTRFLYPLSVASGVGVNLFLFLSGFGLTVSALEKPLGVLGFYKKRLLTIFKPMWIALIFILALDYFFHGVTWPLGTVALNFLGLFPQANIFTELNSALWYFTFILFLYLLYPLVFVRKFPLISAVAIYLISYILLKFQLPVAQDVQQHLYLIHIAAFPIGVSFAWLLNVKNASVPAFLSKVFSSRFGGILKYCVIGFFFYYFCYTAIYSGVGKGPILEEWISMATVACIVMVALLKDFTSEFLVKYGEYSYEVYLIHWVILYRFDFLYNRLPGGIATALYIGLFFVLALGLRWLVKVLSFKAKNPNAVGSKI